jgi:hypothetical protein
MGRDRDDAIALDPDVNSLCRRAGPVDDVRSSQDQIHGALLESKGSDLWTNDKMFCYLAAK